MAAGMLDHDDNVSSILELFRGRFDEIEVECLLRKHGDDIRETANYILTTEPRVLREYLEGEVGAWNLVENLDRLRRENLIKSAKKGLIHTSVRLFACEPCGKFWWRRVPKRKMVSQCNGLYCQKQKYRAIPRKREWGSAIYKCPECYKQFRSWGQMELVHIPCFGCGTPIKPSMIIPPTRDNRNRGQSRHRCLAPDCFSRRLGPMWTPPVRPSMIRPTTGNGGQRRPGKMWTPPVRSPTGKEGQRRTDPMWTPPEAETQHILITCVHPISRRMNGKSIVVIGSDPHQSTGSTVATFLPQDDHQNDYSDIVVFEPALASISEGGSD